MIPDKLSCVLDIPSHPISSIHSLGDELGMADGALLGTKLGVNDGSELGCDDGSTDG